MNSDYWYGYEVTHLLLAQLSYILLDSTYFML